jgi:hypothetical protein
LTYYQGMRLSSAIAVGAILASSLASPFLSNVRDVPGTVSFPLEKRSPASDSTVLKHRATKRGTVLVPDPELGLASFFIQLFIGTPPQATYVQLDTGSSLLNVETDKSNICQQPAPNPCTQFGFCMIHIIAYYIKKRTNSS